MAKTMKKLLALTLAAIMVLSMIPAVSAAEEVSVMHENAIITASNSARVFLSVFIVFLLCFFYYFNIKNLLLQY